MGVARPEGEWVRRGAAYANVGSSDPSGVLRYPNIQNKKSVFKYEIIPLPMIHPMMNGGVSVDNQNTSVKPTTSYKEIKIGHTTFRVTSVFSGEKDLGKTLEQLAVRRALTESASPSPVIGAS